MIEWMAWLGDVARREPAAMISVLASEGSAPRGAGTRMVVTADRLFGTIGGGQLEFRAVEQARAILGHPAGTWRVQDYPLGPLLGQCCGGRVRLLIEHVEPAGLGWLGDAGENSVLVTQLCAGRVDRKIAPNAMVAPISARGALPGEGAGFVEAIGRYRRPLYLFGAGHVGQAIARHAANLPFRLAWFDTRADFAGMEGVTVVGDEGVEGCVAEAPGDAAVVILTHDHGLDYRLTRAALGRAELDFVGLIGSGTKRARFLSRLESDGVAPEDRARLTCPIGVAGVTGKEPDVIAIATLAQLLGLPTP
jgi:xanthine dehydrogenase accessory factor